MDCTTNIQEPHRMSAGKLVIGLILLAVGVVTFLDGIDVFHSGELWNYWPVILIAIGLANEIDAIRMRRRDGSYILLAVGVWLFVGNFELFGLSYVDAFPLGIVVVGLGIILHALIDRPAETKENEHERQ
jgi:hypothetical protein